MRELLEEAHLIICILFMRLFGYGHGTPNKMGFLMGVFWLRLNLNGFGRIYS